MRRPIGIFDSGVGGLTVAKEIRRLLPHEDIIYVGDTARAPYGGKDEPTLLNHGRDIIRFLQKKDVKAVVMACGTSSSTSFEQLRGEFPNLPMVDTIRPGAKAVLELAANRPGIRLCFVATAATIKNGLFTRLISQERPDLVVHARACPLFAPMVEAGLAAIKNHPLTRFVAEFYLCDLRGQVDAVVLGCTHYPLLTDALTYALGDITFINPAQATAQAAKELLSGDSGDGDHNDSDSPGKTTFYTSGDPEAFARTAHSILLPTHHIYPVAIGIVPHIGVGSSATQLVCRPPQYAHAPAQ
ncbi:MAG: glutamate racemase [Defluviitaleaceae bacterium]|nr:glutamate racemase [Defluviitaleaceae bacterium]